MFRKTFCPDNAPIKSKFQSGRFDLQGLPGGQNRTGNVRFFLFVCLFFLRALKSPTCLDEME